MYVLSAVALLLHKASVPERTSTAPVQELSHSQRERQELQRRVEMLGTTSGEGGFDM